MGSALIWIVNNALPTLLKAVTIGQDVSAIVDKIRSAANSGSADIEDAVWLDARNEVEMVHKRIQDPSTDDR